MEIQNTKGHKTWLRKQLKEHDINDAYLLGLAIVVERIIQEEKRKQNRYASKPFYMLFKEGKPTRAWLYMAELALFCKHREYNPAEYVRSLCSLPEIRKRIFSTKEQIPLSFLSPSTRLGAAELRKREDHYLRQAFLAENAY